MPKGLGTRTSTNTLIHRLRLMADSGGMLTRNRIRDVIEAADRLEELDERVAIMSETDGMVDINIPDDGMIPFTGR